MPRAWLLVWRSEDSFLARRRAVASVYRCEVGVYQREDSFNTLSHKPVLRGVNVDGPPAVIAV
jgi:hypothetical protein